MATSLGKVELANDKIVIAMAVNYNLIVVAKASKQCTFPMGVGGWLDQLRKMKTQLSLSGVCAELVDYSPRVLIITYWQM